MKYLAIAALFSIAFVSCQDIQLQMGQVHRYNDTIPNVIPNLSTVQTRVDDNEHLKLIVGSPRFYSAATASMQEAAVKAGQAALAIFGNGITSGTLIITQDLKDHQEDPADGIKVDMKIDSLKKAALPK